MIDPAPVIYPDPSLRSNGLPLHRRSRGTRFLVVDDDARNSFALSALLEQGGADVEVADSGVAALATLERKPDVEIVLMDIMMPIMDGYTTIRAIRQVDRLRDLPIVVVTGKVMSGERQRCIDAGRERLRAEARRRR